MDLKKRYAGLESVEVTKTGSLNTTTNLITGWLIVILLIAAGAVLRYISYAAAIPALYLVGLFVLLITSIWLWEYILSCLVIRTTSTGLTILSLFGHVTLNWAEVREVYTAFGILMPKHYIVAGEKKICIPIIGMKSIAQLEASIYQHLVTAAKVERMKLSREGMSVFNRIPRYIPDNQEWFNLKQQNMILLIFKVSVFCIVFASMAWKFNIASAVFFYLPFLSSIYNWIKASQATARSVHLYPEGLIVTTSAKSVDMDWEDIAEAEWVNKSTIYIKDADSEEVFIPVIKTDPESCMLILGFLRGLRDNTHFTLPIPEYILTRVLECPIDVKLGRE